MYRPKRDFLDVCPYARTSKICTLVQFVVDQRSNSKLLVSAICHVFRKISRFECFEKHVSYRIYTVCAKSLVIQWCHDNGSRLQYWVRQNTFLKITKKKLCSLYPSTFHYCARLLNGLREQQLFLHNIRSIRSRGCLTFPNRLYPRSSNFG